MTKNKQKKKQTIPETGNGFYFTLNFSVFEKMLLVISATVILLFVPHKEGVVNLLQGFG